MEFLKKIYSVRLFRFMTVGLSGVLINEGTLTLLHRLFDLPVSMAGLIAIELAILNNFYWNSRWTWHDRESDGFFTSLFQYHVIALTAGSINYTILMALSGTGWIPEIANLAGMAGGVSVNFLGNHFWTFKSLTEENNDQLIREQRYSFIWFILSMNSLILLYILDLNTTFFLTVNHLSEYTGPDIWIVLTMLGDGLLAALLLSPFAGKNSRILRQYLFAVFVSTLLLQFLKSYFDIPRPPAVLGHDLFHIIGPVLNKRSFPSGHSTTVFTTLLILLPWLKRTDIKIMLSGLALLAAVSRLVVGVHWPADVAGAGMVAAFSVFLVWLIIPAGRIQESRKWNIGFGILYLLGALYAMIFNLSKYPHGQLIQLIIGLFALAFILPVLMKNIGLRSKK